MNRWVRRLILIGLLLPMTLGVRCGGGGDDAPPPPPQTAISGRILHPDGSPAARFPVTVWFQPPGGYVGCGSPPPPQEPVARYAVTDADGRYRYASDESGLPAVEYSVVPDRASALGEFRFSPDYRAGEVSYGSEVGGIDFTAYRIIATLSGTVIDNAGVPFQGASVTVATASAASPFTFTATTGTDGVYSVAVCAGDYRITPSAYPSRAFVPAERTLSVFAEGPIGGLDFAEAPLQASTQGPGDPASPAADRETVAK